MLSSRPIPARGWKRTLLLVDAVFLIIMGVFGFVSDLASYVAGSGSFQGVFMNDPRVIGVVEAHGLAILTGVAGFAHLSSSGRSYWHLHFATTHLLFGGANIAFFGVFSMVQAVLMGTVVTVIHFAFAGAQVIAFRGYSGEGFPGQAARSQ